MLGRTVIRFVTAADRPLVRYAIAALAVLVALAARTVVAIATDNPANFSTFYVAVLVAAMFGGAGAGLAAMALTTAIAWRLWLIDPHDEILHTREAVQIAMFLVCGGLIVFFVESMRLAVRSGLAAEERFRTAQEVSLDAFVILEPVREGGKIIDFRWTYANPAAEAMRPVGASTLVGRRVREAFGDQTGSAMAERLIRLFETDGPDDIDVHRVINGEARCIRSSGVKLGRDLAVTFRDVTRERRQAEDLRTSEELFRGVANAAPVLIWTSDASGDCTWFNAAWLTFTGRTLEQESGQGWSEGVHPEDLGGGLDEVKAAVRARRPFQVFYRLRRADGAWRWINSAGAPRNSEQGDFLGYIGSCVDVTEGVEARQNLEARVAERTAALEASIAEKAKAEAALAQAQRLETVGRLTGGVAHDFNNLLTVIVGGLDMILRHPSDEARVKRLAEAALAAGQRGERLTRQLLAFSRNQELKLETVDIAGLVNQIEPLLRRAVNPATGLVIDCAAAAGSSQVDAAQFEAALLNLVVNAMDATPDDGEIRVQVSPVRLADGEVPDTAPGDYVRVAVTDTGAGMSPEVLARVFEPFFTTKEVGKGTGLGLAQVYGFLRQSGGGVAIDSVEGRGSTVALYLPAATAVAGGAGVSTERAASPPETSKLADKRVLLVEDDDSVRAIAEGALLDFGCSVVTALDGASALATLDREAPFDLLMSDIIMPGGVSGVDLAHAASARDPGMAILLTTGYAGDRLSMTPAELPWPLLRKPFRVEQLAEALVAVLDSRQRDA